MAPPYRFRIASFDTDVAPGPVGMAEISAGEEIAAELQAVLQTQGHRVGDVDLRGNYAWFFSLKVGKSRFFVELFGAVADRPWMLFVTPSSGCLWLFRASRDDHLTALRTVDSALRQVSTVRNVRWHEAGPEIATVGESLEHPT